MVLMKTTIDNPKYRRMLMPQCSADWIEYLDFVTDFYFSVMLALGEVGFRSQFRAQMTSSLQMMFAKGKSMRTLLDGYNYKKGTVTLQGKPDHTILFTLVRAAYEQLCAFELVYVIPDTDDKRIIMENAYVAAAEVNRLKMFTTDELERNFEKVDSVKQKIEECKNAIRQTALFQSLSEKEKLKLEEVVFKNGEYRIVIDKEGKLRFHVGWDDVRNYCRLKTNALHGLYKFACNMAHPSYLGLIQFHDAYREGVIDELNDTAVMHMISIMSVYIVDFLGEFPEAKTVYDQLDDEAQFAIRMYNDGFREQS